MKGTSLTIAVLGLGEAGSRFANDLAGAGVAVSGYDPNPIRALDPRIQLKESNPEAVRGAGVILSVNLSSVSAAVAGEVTPMLSPGQFYCEMNTSGPKKKEQIAKILSSSGARMVDVAIMAPVPERGIFTPLMASGEHAKDLAAHLESLNLNITTLDNSKIGEAATRKLLRSIVYKGFAAVICEAMTAGKAFDREEYIRGQIASLMGGNESLIDRFVEGSYTHAHRRTLEMEAVMDMLESMGVDQVMTTATRNHLRKISESKENSLRGSSMEQDA